MKILSKSLAKERPQFIYFLVGRKKPYPRIAGLGRITDLGGLRTSGAL